MTRTSEYEVACAAKEVHDILSSYALKHHFDTIPDAKSIEDALVILMKQYLNILRVIKAHSDQEE